LSKKTKQPDAPRSLNEGFEPKPKPRFKFNVVEVRRYNCVYIVEGDTLEQARDMAEVGNYVAAEAEELDEVVTVRVLEEVK
jgi:hypothetical protein